MKLLLILLSVISFNIYSNEKIELEIGSESSSELESFIAKAKENLKNLESFEIVPSEKAAIDFEILSNSDSLYLDTYNSTYRNGDLYYLLAAKDEWGKKEWNYFYSLSKWAVNRGFRTILIPNTTSYQLKEAVQNDNTTVIIWSSHGAKSGYVTDFNNHKVPKGSFSNNRGERFNHLVLNNCHGEATIRYYDVPAGTVYWTGLTDSDAMIRYLNSKTFDQRVLKSLGKSQF